MNEDSNQPPRGRCLVFGASGYVGGHLVPRLGAAGLQVRAASRNRSTLEPRRARSRTSCGW